MVERYGTKHGCFWPILFVSLLVAMNGFSAELGELSEEDFTRIIIAEAQSIIFLDSPAPLLSILDDCATGSLGDSALVPGEEALPSFPTVPKRVFGPHYRPIDSVLEVGRLLTTREEVVDAYRVYYAVDRLERIAPFDFLKWLATRAEISTPSEIDIVLYYLLYPPGSGIMLSAMKKGSFPPWTEEGRKSLVTMVEGTNPLLQIVAMQMIPYAGLEEEKILNVCSQALAGKGSIMHYYALKALERFASEKSARLIKTFLARLPEPKNDGSIGFIERPIDMRAEAEASLRRICEEIGADPNSEPESE